MKALIVEDEIINFEGLKRIILRTYPQAEVVGPVTNLMDLEQAMMHQEQFDVVYCDIQLEDGQCFSVLEHVEVSVPLVFTTAYSEFALKAFAANALGYLLKPVKQSELQKVTDRALSLGRGNQNIEAMLRSLGLDKHPSYLHYLRAEAFDGSYIVDVEQVSHFTTCDKKSIAILTDGTTHRIGYNLEALMERLNPAMFFRANRQTIVNRRAISRIQTYGNRQLSIRLSNPDFEPVIVSRENAAALNDWIEI